MSGRPPLQDQPYTISPRPKAVPFTPKQKLTASRLNEVREQSNTVGGAPAPRQYVPTVGGGAPAGTAFRECFLLGVIENGADATALDDEYSQSPLIVENYNEINDELQGAPPYILAVAAYVPNDDWVFGLQPDWENLIRVLPLPPQTPDNFKTPAGDQIYDAELLADPNRPTFVAFRGALNWGGSIWTLLKGHGEVWIAPTNLGPSEDTYC